MSPSFVRVATSLATRLNVFTQSVHVEVQERAAVAQALLEDLGIPFEPVMTPELEAKKKAREEAAMLAMIEGTEAPTEDVKVCVERLRVLLSPSPFPPAPRPSPTLRPSCRCCAPCSTSR